MSDANEHVMGEDGQFHVTDEAVDLSVAIASKLIQRNITKEDNERLIGETLKEIESKRVN